MIWRILLLLSLTRALCAEDTLRICIYSDNRGAGAVHREILNEAKLLQPRLFVINGDIVKFDYGRRGSPDAVLDDYRTVMATPTNSLVSWPSAPGPVILVVPGGHDEQYFLSPRLAAMADAVRGGRYAYEGTAELGMKLYQAFDLEQMRIRVQPLSDLASPLPMSRYGDYLLVVGNGPRRDLAILVLYRTDRWGFRSDQVDWIDSTLKAFRIPWPNLPLLVFGHDWTWFLPDVLDDGTLDGPNNSIREGSAESDHEQKQRLRELLLAHRADLAVAADRHEYWASVEGPLLKVNSAAALCTDVQGRKAAADNVWLEYAQSAATLSVVVHPIRPPIGCGLRPEAAESGTRFEKNRRAGSSWRIINL